MKRCLHRKVDFNTNALNNAHVSQLLHYKAGVLQNDGITPYFKIIINSLQVDTYHRTLLNRYRYIQNLTEEVDAKGFLEI